LRGLKEIQNDYRARKVLRRKAKGSLFDTPGDIASRLLKLGFEPDLFHVYSMKKDLSDVDNFLSTIDWHKNARYLSRPFNIVADDKILFRNALKDMEEIVPNNILLFSRGEIFQLPDWRCITSNEAEEVLLSTSTFLKPVRGSLSGKGVLACLADGSDLTLNDKPASAKNVIETVLQSGVDYIACQRVEQHPQMAGYFPRTVNTLRIQTFWDDQRGQPEIVAAVLKIGSDLTYPVDNIKKGGFVAGVDLASGRLSEAAGIRRRENIEARTLVWHDRHPDTAGRFTDTVIPHWERVKTRMLAACRRVPYLSFVGWDVIVTEDDIAIVEANPVAEMKIVQMHFPLLANPRFRAFCIRRGMISN
jgi:hypothetical protein